jgi:hypothetical protein
MVRRMRNAIGVPDTMLRSPTAHRAQGVRVPGEERWACRSTARRRRVRHWAKTHVWDCISSSLPPQRSPRLAVDDLRVVSTSDGIITCSFDNLGETSTIALAAITGERIEGTRLKSLRPPDAPA